MRAAILLLCTTPLIAQTTHEVPADFATIQAAVDAAVNGDTVLIAPGTYVENVIVDNKIITIRGEHGANATTLDGNAAATVLTLRNGADGTVDGLRLTNGYANSTGGGIYVFEADPTITNCRIEHNWAHSDGGGIGLRTSMATITNCIVRENQTLYWDGGGIHMVWCTGTVIAHCTIVDNTAAWDGWGGGIWDATGGGLITNCIIKDNVAGFIDWDVSVHTPTVVQYSNFRESNGSNGNINVNPEFTGQNQGDLHLKITSPCIGAGLASAPGVPATDMDGNPRGGSVDMGADEYGAAGYLVGNPTQGGQLTVRCGGVNPGSPMQMWVDVGLRSVPLQTPFGEWWLAVRRIEVIGGTAGADGWLTTTWNVPPAAPSGPLFGQGIVGPRITPYWAGVIQ